jgi:carbon-monoxide dehydrogenase medium subunit
MYDFTYHKPASVADAVKLLAADPEARPIAGGQTLLPALKLRLNRPTAVVDLSGLTELRGIRREGNTIVIGAMAKHFEIATSSDVKAAIPALAHMASTIGDTQVRNRGTLGGSVANNDPSADYPAALLALGATIETDKRKLKAEDFFQGMFATALDAGELVTAVHIPVPDKAGYAKMRNPASRYSMAGVFVAKGPAGRARRGERRGRERRVPPRWDGAGARCQLVAAGRRECLDRRVATEQRHPWQRRVPRAPDRRHGQARGG